jgi:hypothetical protein
MGMYNELNKINQSISQQAVEIKKTQEHQKMVEYVKSELDGILLASLMTKTNIFDDDTKSIAIDEVINNTDVLLYNKDYTRQYVNKRYYTIARQVEQVKKKQSDNNDYKKRIALEKWELQRQKIQLQIERERQKIDTKQQKEAAKIEQQKAAKRQRIMRNTEYTISSIVKVMLYIAIAPIFIISFIFTGFLGGMMKGK